MTKRSKLRTLPAPLVASPGVSPDVAAAFDEGGRTAVAAYQGEVARRQAVSDAADAKQDQIDAEDRAQKNHLATLAYQYQQSAAQTKAQNAVEWNQSHWDSVTGQYLSNLGEKQANAETWLDPKNVNNITPESQAQARNVVSQVQGIYQHVANNTPTDFSTYHEPADVINAKPFTAEFTPQFTDAYKADLESKKQKDIDQDTHVQLENQKLAWEVAHPKQAHSGGGGADERWYKHEDYKEQIAEQKSFYRDFGKASSAFITSRGRLQAASHGASMLDASPGGQYESLVNSTNDAAAELSGHLSQWGSADPSNQDASDVWNAGRNKFNGLSTYHDIDNFFNSTAAKIHKLPAGPDFNAALSTYKKLHSAVYGGASQ